jgi:DNA polymerase-3 subunit delta'
MSGPVPAGAVFDSLVGQDHAVAALSAAAADPAALAHAWLITGPAGSGRSVAARAFAAALQCTASQVGCGGCQACRLVLSGNHPDVALVVPEGLSLGVGSVRALVRDATGAPVRGRRRVLVLEDADRLTDEAAAALLKSLEEPAPRTVFVLCAPSAEDLPPTVRSRCRSVTLRVPAPADVAEVLRREGVDPAVAAFAAAAAQGHVGRARALALDEAARTRRADVLSHPRRLAGVSGALAAAGDLVAAAGEEAAASAEARNAGETAALRASLGLDGGSRGRAAAARGTAGPLKELERAQKARATRITRDSLDRALLDLAALYRDVLRRQLGAGGDPVHPDQSGTVEELARVTTPDATLRRIEAILAAREAIGANVGAALAVEAMALALRSGE